MIDYDPEERGHIRGRCRICGAGPWSDDCGNCPNGCGTEEPQEEECESA